MKKYFKLKAMRSIAGIIAIAAIFALSMAACENGTTGGGPGGNNNPGGNTPGGYAPAAPTGLTATAVSTSEIRLNWNAVSGATGYRIYQSQSGNGPFNLLGTTPGNGDTNNNLPANITLYYRVTAYNSYGESGFSNIASATTLGGGTTHTHSWGAWQSNASQHWRVCTGCGEENGRASHSGNPCTVCGYRSIVLTETLDGTWDSSQNHTVTFSGTGATLVATTNPLYIDAISKGYIKIGDTMFRNLTKTADLTWKGQRLTVYYTGTSTATGTTWNDTTISLSSNGRTFGMYTPGKENPDETWTRR